MEYLPDGDLFEAVQEKRFKEPRARQVIADVLSALAHIHRRGIVHRDVKAENILVAKDGRAVLTDFDTAAFVSDKDAMRQRCGSPGHIAPEVLSSKLSYGIKVDSFGAGAVLYFMICGHLPFEGSDMKEVLHKTRTRAVSFHNHSEFSQVSDQCKAFIFKLLQKIPDNRLSAEQAASQLWCMPSIEERISRIAGQVDKLEWQMGVATSDVSTSASRTFRSETVVDEHPLAPQLHDNQQSFLTNEAHNSNAVDEESGRSRWPRKLHQLVSKFRTSTAASERSYSFGAASGSVQSTRSASRVRARRFTAQQPMKWMHAASPPFRRSVTGQFSSLH